MDDVDGLIVKNLQGIGCGLPDDATVKQLSSEEILEAVVRCLWLICPEIDVKSFLLPPSMTARFRLASTIAASVKDLGYKGDLGYQTLLYGSEVDVRRLLIFLTERLPKEVDVITATEQTPLSAILKTASATLQKELNQPFIPWYCKRMGYVWDGRYWTPQVGADTIPFRSLSLNLNGSQSGALLQKWERNWRHLPASVLELLSTIEPMQDGNLLSAHFVASCSSKFGALSFEDALVQYFCTGSALESSKYKVESTTIKGPKPTIAPRPKHLTSMVTDNANKDQSVADSAPDTELADINKRIEEAQVELERILSECEIAQQRITEIDVDLDVMTSESTIMSSSWPELEKELKRLRKLEELLINPEAVEKIHEYLLNSGERIQALEKQWFEHSAPLDAELKRLQGDGYIKHQKLLSEIENTKIKIADFDEESIAKEKRLRQLNKELESMNKTTNRSAYTKRILDILANIRKQREEIDRILNDTRTSQRELNFLRGRLDRSFTDADELIFKHAKQSDAMRKAYKLVVELHKLCSEMVQIVEDTGSMAKECRDLEDQIETENLMSPSSTLEKLITDYYTMKEENDTLEQRFTDLGRS